MPKPRRATGGGSIGIGVLAAAAMLLCATAFAPATAQEDHSGLTRATYRQRCLMCHSKAAPEGVSPEILAGLHPVPGLKPRDAMPTLLCWRRCTDCWPKNGDQAR